MKQLLSFFILAGLFLFVQAASAQGQDKSKRPSPPATATQTLKTGAVVTIHYGSPSLKGRTIGTDVEPNDGKVWRAGANEATVFEATKDVMVEGKNLPAGKYALFVLKNGADWSFIFNKVWETWGAYDYDKNKSQDVLQVKATVAKAEPVAEKLVYTIDQSGKVSLGWGAYLVSFNVK